VTTLRQTRATAPPLTVDELAQHPAPDDRAATILVCDDDPSLRELVRAVLGPRYHFLEAADGIEALALAREERPELIVLDVMLPGLSGIEVLEKLRTDEELKETRVVVITAWSHAEIDAQVAGADRFVAKPFDPDDLSTVVAELLGVGSTEPTGAEGPASPGPERGTS
jgi:CheY-like chemotaxis protein